MKILILGPLSCAALGGGTCQAEELIDDGEFLCNEVCR